MKNIILIAVALFILLPNTSMAGRGGGGFSYEEGLFFVADKNRNQQLDRKEARAVHNLSETEIFARFDEDSNGFINRLEFKEYL